MQNRSTIQIAAAAGMSLLPVLVLVSGCTVASMTQPPSGDDPEASLIEQGERLVHNMDCNVCHTPKVMTPQGPGWDQARLLSGHPEAERLPPLPPNLIGPEGWGGVFSQGLTAWVGPWGASFGSNLTPDLDTGAGGWTEEMFIEAMRTGTHIEDAKPFLPPMPTYARLTDGELRAMFAYLKSIKPVVNVVPDAVPPSALLMTGE